MSAGNVSADFIRSTVATAESATKRFYPKTHTNYWKSRLEHRSYTRDGQTFEVAEWSVRIHFKGIRKSFDLETANKEEAATKARDIYLSILAKGWTATINELAPQLVPLADLGNNSATIGGFLAEVERTANLKPKTFRYYASCLRQFAAYVQGVKSDVSRFDYRKGGATAWRQQVDAIPLSALTPAAVADYKMIRLKRAGSDPRRKLEVNRSFNSWLRNRRSLSSWPFAWTRVLAEHLMTEHRDSRLARRQAMLRQQIRDGAIRRAFLPQFSNDILRRHQVLELLWTPRSKLIDRFADCGWVKCGHDLK